MFELLGLLPLLRRGLVPYYQALVSEPEPTLRVAAIIALLELHAVWSTQADIVIDLCKFGAVKRRAFPFFLSVFEYERAQIVAESSTEDVDALLSGRMRAELNRDFDRVADFSNQLFLATGLADYLWQSEQFAEQAGGWRRSLPYHLLTMLARPMDPNGPFQVLSVLHNANQPALVARVCTSFETAQIYLAEVAAFRAAGALDAGDAKAALKLLDRMPSATPNARLNAFALQTRAEALDREGRFRDAYTTFQRMNAVAKPADIDPQSYARGVLQRAKYEIPKLSADNRESSLAIMLGFPRSGTTLLENALAAHPLVETLEETPALSRMARWLERFSVAGRPSVDVATTARDKYFDELRRMSKRSSAAITVDKMPMASADAVVISRMLTDIKYIFSIRHPHDVVLSCFRQNFTPNAAMENFRSVAGAAALYDFAMTQWFSVHDFDDPKVCYLRYDDLVTAFQPSMERALAFLGLPWSEAVLGFADAADKRHAKTPSYKKVRSGISIGVQSSRDNYKFVFESKETAVLKKWVEHFGYSA